MYFNKQKLFISFLFFNVSCQTTKTYPREFEYLVNITLSEGEQGLEPEDIRRFNIPKSDIFILPLNGSPSRCVLEKNFPVGEMRILRCGEFAFFIDCESGPNKLEFQVPKDNNSAYVVNILCSLKKK